VNLLKPMRFVMMAVTVVGILAVAAPAEAASPTMRIAPSSRHIANGETVDVYGVGFGRKEPINLRECTRTVTISHPTGPCSLMNAAGTRANSHGHLPGVHFTVEAMRISQPGYINTGCGISKASQNNCEIIAAQGGVVEAVALITITYP